VTLILLLSQLSQILFLFNIYFFSTAILTEYKKSLNVLLLEISLWWHLTHLTHWCEITPRCHRAFICSDVFRKAVAWEKLRDVLLVAVVGCQRLSRLVSWIEQAHYCGNPFQRWWLARSRVALIDQRTRVLVALWIVRRMQCVQGRWELLVFVIEGST